MHKNTYYVFLYCGHVVKNQVNKWLITIGVFAHIHIFKISKHLVKNLYTFLAHFIHQVLYTFFIKFTSVSLVFYTQSTTPTITTTYNI